MIFNVWIINNAAAIKYYEKNKERKRECVRNRYHVKDNKEKAKIVIERIQKKFKNMHEIAVETFWKTKNKKKEIWTRLLDKSYWEINSDF